MSGEQTTCCSRLAAHNSPLTRQRRRNFLPIWSCSVWGLPCPRHYCRGGALLPHLFTLTLPPWVVRGSCGRGQESLILPRNVPASSAFANDQRRATNDPQQRGGMFSVALSVDQP